MLPSYLILESQKLHKMSLYKDALSPQKDLTLQLHIKVSKRFLLNTLQSKHIYLILDLRTYFTMVVIKYIFLLLLALAAITYAAPAMLSISIRARVCSPENMLVDVSDYSCPKTNEIDKGHCASTIPNIPNKEGCSAYCEVRLTKRFGQEMPISNR